MDIPLQVMSAASERCMVKNCVIAIKIVPLRQRKSAMGKDPY